MGDDEIKFGVGIDASSFDGGLAKVRQKVDDTSASIQKSFNKANSGARDFKKLIAEVSENVPGLGLALKGVFNPIAAAIAGATLALGYFRNKLADWNADMDRQSEDAATPMGNFAHATEKARVEIAELQRAHKKFAEDMAKSNDDLLDGLKKQIEALESQSRVHKVILAQVKERKTKEIQESGMTPEQKKAAGTRLDQAYAGAQNVTAYRQLQAEQAARLATKDALNKKVSAATFRMQSLDDDPLVSEAAFLRRGDRDNYISKLEAEEKAKRAALAKAQDAASKFSRAPASAADLAGMDSHSDLLAAKDYAERYRAAHGVVDSASAALRTTQAALKAERDKKFTEGEAIKNYREKYAAAQTDAMSAKDQIKGVDDQLSGGGLKLHEMLMGMTPAERIASLGGKPKTTWEQRMTTEQQAWQNKLKAERDAWGARTQGYQTFGPPSKKDEAGAMDIITAIETLTKAATEQGIVVKSIANSK